MGTNKTGLYNCVFLCFILWQPAQFKRKNDLPLRYNNSSPKRATISKRIFDFWTFINFLFLPSIDFSFYFCIDALIETGRNLFKHEREEISFFQQDFGESIVHIGKNSINFKKITRIDVVPSGTNRLLVNPL